MPPWPPLPPFPPLLELEVASFSELDEVSFLELDEFAVSELISEFDDFPFPELAIESVEEVVDELVEGSLWAMPFSISVVPVKSEWVQAKNRIVLSRIRYFVLFIFYPLLEFWGSVLSVRGNICKFRW